MTGEAGVIVFASQKGGSGKTTLSGHIAVEAERSGDGPVALIDTDPQGSLAKWWNARTAEQPAFAHVPLDELDDGIAHLKRNGFKLIVVDTPPAVTEAIASTVSHADLVVVPTRPSPHDLRAVGPTVDIIEGLHKDMLFVVNSATSRARITSETAVALSQHGVVAPVTVHHRVDFAASMIDGRTVGEARKDSKSAEEIAGLWRYMRDRLYRITGGPPGVRLDDFATAHLSPVSGRDRDDVSLFEEDDDGFDEDTEQPRDLPVAPAAATPRRDSPPRQAPFGAGALSPDAASAATPAAASTPAAPSPAPAGEPANGNWDGVDRRRQDIGPPPGQPDRRRVFGRRFAAPRG